MITMLVSAALAGGVSVGVGVGATKDLPDAHGKFGFGPELQIPVKFEVTQKTFLRVDLQAGFATGRDRVTWGREVDGEEVRFYSDEHWTLVTHGQLVVGADVMLPIDFPLYLGLQAGAAMIGNYHALGGTSADVLLDPSQNDIGDPGNIDPFSQALVPVSAVHVGTKVPLGALDLWGEVGYTVAFLGAKPLAKTPSELGAMREPFGWNPLRLVVGVSFGG